MPFTFTKLAFLPVFVGVRRSHDFRSPAAIALAPIICGNFVISFQPVAFGTDHFVLLPFHFPPVAFLSDRKETDIVEAVFYFPGVGCLLRSAAREKMLFDPVAQVPGLSDIKQVQVRGIKQI